ncbi:hypothetical protein RFI_19199 [Reticulomyxa filosa]|uniref:Uncharacterized protein n=1 Tax=Reticulomyxa filosa TaxID=46433 RepID=X6MYD6_RETFI|nr:hypothetical protein RFI_19199 [Reticulomyxa filosa]|eukprot:ETO18090.1 hypothetical protein RFI_19199 [Reticulomyxa filosa]
MAELLNGLIWHVHLMSHENIFNATKELVNGKHIEYRKCDKDEKHDNENTMKTQSGKSASRPCEPPEEENKTSYTTKVDSTKSIVIGTLSTLRGGQKIFIYQRVTDLYFVDDMLERTLKLSDLVTALKGLQFHYEPMKNTGVTDTRSTFDYHLQSAGSYLKKKKNK